MKRLMLEESADRELAELLRSAEQDGPPSPEALEQRQNRIFAAMLTVTSAPRGLSFVTSRTGLWRAAKWVPLCAVAATIGITGWTRSSVEHKNVDPNAMVAAGAATSMTSMVTAPVEVPTTRAEAPRVDRPEPAVVDNAGTRVEDLPTASPKPASATPPRVERTALAARRGPSASNTDENTIDAELAAIEAARGVLAAGRSNDALGRVNDYRITFPNAHFADEADVIEVQALVALGRVSEANVKAEQFLAAHPQSPYAKRIRALVAPKE